MSIGKKGILENNLYESNSILLNVDDNNYDGNPLFTPISGTNICKAYQYIDFSDYLQESSLPVHIECDVFWSAFTSNTNGTLNIYWQGTCHEISSDSNVWTGANYVTDGLNGTMTLNSLLSNGTAGSYHYDLIRTIPASWLSTYSGCKVAIRCDYSNGSGRIRVCNFKVTPVKYYGNSVKIANNSISSNTFYEI